MRKREQETLKLEAYLKFYAEYRECRDKKQSRNITDKIIPVIQPKNNLDDRDSIKFNAA